MEHHFTGTTNGTSKVEIPHQFWIALSDAIHKGVSKALKENQQSKQEHKDKAKAEPEVFFSKSVPEATFPKRNTDADAGWDLFMVTPPTEKIPGSKIDYTPSNLDKDAIEIKPNEKAVIRTGIRWIADKKWCLQIKSRSSMFNKGLICTGLVDSGYRGEIAVVLWNISKKPISIWTGEKIAQAHIEYVYQGPVEYLSKEKYEAMCKENPSKRGTGGFGSSDKKDKQEKQEDEEKCNT